jgi:multimeric flavodoxin WrbA
MKISLINGSQKIGESNSGIILDRLNNLIKEKHEVKTYKVYQKSVDNKMLKDIISGEIIVLAFPLYVDSIPSHTLKMLIELEIIVRKEQPKDLIIYAIINNGFYEGKQNHIAFEIIKNWCEHSGIKFGGGIGQGAGEMLGSTKKTPINKGPFNNLGRALQSLVESMELKETFKIKYLNPYFPRFLWKIMATILMWHPLAYKNGLNKKDIIRRI